MVDIGTAIVVTLVLALPLVVTAGAFLDAARRPEWAWLLAGRRRALWMAMLIVGGFSLIFGPAVAIAYFVTARKDVAAAERGDI